MTYPGGKEGAGVYQRIICQIPPHTTYVEGFLGGGAVMRLKRPAIASIGIDADADVIAAAGAWAGSVPGLRLVCADALGWLAAATITSDTFVYLDPPYLLATRRQKHPIYRYELTDEQHAALLRLITRLPCMVAISGYPSDMYERALAGWRAIQFTSMTRGNTQAVEWLWMNYNEPMELHDYAYLGEGFRERERIKRKKARWTAKLRAMPTLERHALMAAIEALRGSAITTPKAAREPGQQVTKSAAESAAEPAAAPKAPWSAPSEPAIEATVQSPAAPEAPRSTPPEPAIQPGRHTSEMAMTPETASVEGVTLRHIPPPAPVTIGTVTPEEAPATDLHAESADGCRQTAPRTAIPPSRRIKEWQQQQPHSPK